MEQPVGLSVVVPTYRREAVLVETIRLLLPQLGSNTELLIVDQTNRHLPATQAALSEWSDRGVLRWIRLDKPSVTRAMNVGLSKARGEAVLFLDDDIVPALDLLDRHLAAHRDAFAGLIAGRVVQPWHDEKIADAPFRWPDRREVREFMGGNFSICRETAIAVGGFDENFRYAAYRYEREFADRLRRSGYDMTYVPDAWLDHLKADEGGVRHYGEHLTTAGPGHALGAYYYILGSAERRIPRAAGRLIGAFTTKFHLRRPWYIPVTIFAELRGLFEAVRLWRRGPQLINGPGEHP